MKAILFLTVGLILIGAGGAHAGDKTPDNTARNVSAPQTNLVEIYLQLAESLSRTGSPIPFLRHVKAEQDRIMARFEARYGKPGGEFLPVYLTDAYLDRVDKNWAYLSSNLALTPIVQNIGRKLAEAIRSSSRQGIQKLLYDHQRYAVVAGRSNNCVEIFEPLRLKLLSEVDKGQGAFSTAQEIKRTLENLCAKLDSALKPEDAAHIKAVINNLALDIGRSADSELLAASSEKGFDRQILVEDGFPDKYSADQEKALSPAERDQFAVFLKKEHFQRTDFPDLEKFYAGAYDKLSERGKDELSHRIYAGTKQTP